VTVLVLAACAPGPVPGESVPDDIPTVQVFVPGEPVPERSVLLTGGRIAVDGDVVVESAPGTVTVLAGDPPVRTILQLPSGWDAGQVAVGAGRAWVVLRGIGAVLPITTEGVVAAAPPVEVCPEPRGIDADGEIAVVVCRDGSVVELDDEVLHVTPLADDLRDVVLDGGDLWVSRFRSAEVIRLDRVTRRILSWWAPIPVQSGARTFTPHVAWRMAPNPDGGVVVTDQLHQDDPVTGTVPEYYGPPPTDPNACGGVVLGRVSLHHPDGTVEPVPPMRVAVPYDVAIADDGEIYVAAMGQGNYAFSDVVRVRDGGGECAGLEPVDIARGRSVTARGPELRVGAYGLEPSSESFYESGSALVACASCHPDGRDDGHVWTLGDSGFVPLRTPPLTGALLDTAPYHWDGFTYDLAQLWDSAGIRMGLSASLDADTIAWMELLPDPVPAPARPVADEGQVLFIERCASCHSGSTLTNNESMDVGTGGRFQVPSLLGVAARLPVMHAGCADHLEDIFDPGCGGSAHEAAVEEQDALLAYLESL
jgi:hypothetical protein